MSPQFLIKKRRQYPENKRTITFKWLNLEADLHMQFKQVKVSVHNNLHPSSDERRLRDETVWTNYWKENISMPTTKTFGKNLT